MKKNKAERKKKTLDIGKGQKTLFDYIPDENRKTSGNPSQNISNPNDSANCRADSKVLESFVSKVKMLINNHQLNEVLNIFRTLEYDSQQLFSADIKDLYNETQSEMKAVFGAPISESLFPSSIFREKASYPSEYTTSPQSQKHV